MSMAMWDNNIHDWKINLIAWTCYLFVTNIKFLDLVIEKILELGGKN